MDGKVWAVWLMEEFSLKSWHLRQWIQLLSNQNSSWICESELAFTKLIPYFCYSFNNDTTMNIYLASNIELLQTRNSSWVNITLNQELNFVFFLLLMLFRENFVVKEWPIPIFGIATLVKKSLLRQSVIYTIGISKFA